MAAKLTAIPMGSSIFVTWDQIDNAFDAWAKSYFGPHTKGEGERDDTDCYVSLRGLKGSDFPRFSALFDKFDKDGDYEPDYEFCTGEQTSTLPDCITRGIMSEVFQGFGLQSIGKILAIHDGVFLLENELDYSKVISGRNYATASQDLFAKDEFVFDQADSSESFAAKNEMINTFLRTEDDITVIDPDAGRGRASGPNNHVEAPLRFECNCKSDKQLVKLLDAIREEKCGFNFEVAARLWYTPAGADKTIMVEHQVSTQECRDLTESPDEPDWFTAYEVDNELDDDCSNEIFTETADNYITIQGLKNAMHEFAKEIEKRFVAEQTANLKAPITEQIQSAASRAAAPICGTQPHTKEPEPER